MHGGHVGMQLASAFQLAQDRHHAASAVHVFHMVFGRIGCHFAQLRHTARQAVNVFHGEVNAGLLRHRQQVQNGIGGAAHGDIERDGILKGFQTNGARQHGCVILFVIAFGQFHNQMAGPFEELLAVSVGGHQRAIAGQRQAQCLGQAVHRVGGEHARARAARRASRALHLGDFLVRHGCVSGHHHGVDQIKLDDTQPGFAGLHRAARNKHHRNVQPHGCHQHPRGDLVAVGNAHQRICAMRVDHVFHRVGNDVTARQRIQHAVVAHGNAVIDRNGVELFGHTARKLNLSRHELPQVFQVDMAGHKLSKRVGDGDDGFAEVAVLHAGGAPERACTCHVAASSRGF